jgi:hypothetical protein
MRDGRRDFQGFALETYQSSEAIRKPVVFSAEEDYIK